MRAVRAMRALVLLAPCALLLACVSAPAPRGAPGALPPARSWAQRQALLLQDVDHFSLRGRLAASNGQGGGGSGTLRWRQQGTDAELSLNGPLGIGGARVQLTGGQLAITTSDGRQLAGAAADQRLTALLGFEPPLRSLRYWVLGVNDPLQSATPSLDSRQRLTQLQQGRWRIDYDEYLPVAGQWLPRRLTVSRQDLRLKLVIDAWQL
jgi:outer membrane lipoprotein LolB